MSAGTEAVTWCECGVQFLRGEDQDSDKCRRCESGDKRSGSRLRRAQKRRRDPEVAARAQQWREDGGSE